MRVRVDPRPVLGAHPQPPPGIRELAELIVGDLRLHLFERPGRPSDPRESAVQFQHVCLSVASPEDLSAMRERWIDLHRSGRFTFAVDEPPTEIVVDADGVRSFYAFDVNGLELELSYAPGHRS